PSEFAFASWHTRGCACCGECVKRVWHARYAHSARGWTARTTSACACAGGFHAVTALSRERVPRAALLVPPGLRSRRCRACTRTVRTLQLMRIASRAKPQPRTGGVMKQVRARRAFGPLVCLLVGCSASGDGVPGVHGPANGGQGAKNEPAPDAPG